MQPENNNININNPSSQSRDYHIETAASLFNVPEEQITKAMRQAAKTYNFRKAYSSPNWPASIMTKSRAVIVPDTAAKCQEF